MSKKLQQKIIFFYENQLNRRLSNRNKLRGMRFKAAQMNAQMQVLGAMIGFGGNGNILNNFPNVPNQFPMPNGLIRNLGFYRQGF